MKRILFYVAIAFSIVHALPVGACPVADDAAVTAHGPMLAALSVKDLGGLAPEVAAPATVPAPPVVTSPDADPEAFARTVYDAFKGGQWMLGVALLLIGIVWLLRRPFVLAKIPALGTKRGGALLAFAFAFFTVLVFKLKTGSATSAQMFLAVFALAWTAVGGWNWLKDVLPEAVKTWLAGVFGGKAPTP